MSGIFERAGPDGGNDCGRMVEDGRSGADSMRPGTCSCLGRKKNMIVTEEGKNIYPEDIETVFDALPVKEFCVFAANYIWPREVDGGRAIGVRDASSSRALKLTRMCGGNLRC